MDRSRDHGLRAVVDDDQLVARAPLQRGERGDQRLGVGARAQERHDHRHGRPVDRRRKNAAVAAERRVVGQRRGRVAARVGRQVGRAPGARHPQRDRRQRARRGQAGAALRRAGQRPPVVVQALEQVRSPADRLHPLERRLRRVLVRVVDQQLAALLEPQPVVGQAQRQVGVLPPVAREALVEPADGQQRVAADRDVAGVERPPVAGEAGLVDELAAAGEPAHEAPVGHGRVGRDPADHGQPGIPGGVRAHVAGQESGARGPAVVAQEQDQRGARGGDAGVAGGRRAGPRLLHEAGAGQIACARRAIVDDHDLGLEIAEFLHLKRFERPQQDVPAVPRGDYDREIHGGTSTPPAPGRVLFRAKWLGRRLRTSSASSLTGTAAMTRWRA